MLLAVGAGVGLTLYFMGVGQTVSVSTEEAVVNACEQIDRPSSYDAVYTVDTEEQVILYAQGYNRDAQPVPKVLGRIQASGEDFHITVQLEGVPHPVEIKHVDGASYIREGVSGWQDFGGSSPMSPLSAWA